MDQSTDLCMHTERLLYSTQRTDPSYRHGHVQTTVDSFQFVFMWTVTHSNIAGARVNMIFLCVWMLLVNFSRKANLKERFAFLFPIIWNSITAPQHMPSLYTFLALGRFYYQGPTNPHHFSQILLIHRTPFEDGIRPIQRRGGAAGEVLTLDSEGGSCGLAPRRLAVGLITSSLDAERKLERHTTQTRQFRSALFCKWKTFQEANGT